MDEKRIIVQLSSAVSLGDFKMPNIKDVPRHHTVLVRDAWGPAPFAGKAIGEHSTSPTAPAIVNAIYDATGIQITETPITAEKVYSALRNKDPRK